MKPIEVFIRHCYYSRLQEQPSRSRPIWWDKEKVFQNFKRTLDPDLVNYTIIYDEHYGKIEDTFLSNEPAIIINKGSEAKSFLCTLDIIKERNFQHNPIIYFLEDDYVHRPNWSSILIEAFTLPIHYATLYDHGDKYQEMYQGLMSSLFASKSSHWRAVPSTTNTFAVKYKTLLEDLEVHKRYSTNVEPSLDHQKFCELNSRQRSLVSAIPGYSTHCHSQFLSPCIDWSSYI